MTFAPNLNYVPSCHITSAQTLSPAQTRPTLYWAVRVNLVDDEDVNVLQLEVLEGVLDGLDDLLPGQGLLLGPGEEYLTTSSPHHLTTSPPQYLSTSAPQHIQSRHGKGT